MGHASVAAGALGGRRVVLHADDYGLSPAVSDGIRDGFERGLLTSTSILSNAPDAARAVRAWKRLAEARRNGCLPSSPRRRRLDDPDRDFDLGVHLNLTQGRPLAGDRFPAELLDPEGRLPGIGLLARRLWPRGERFAAALEDELRRQIEFLLDHAERPAHLSGHQYVELLPVVGRIVASLAVRFRIPAVRVAAETAWLRSLRWPGVGTRRWLLAGLERLLARPFRRCIAAAGVTSPDAFFGNVSAGRVNLAQIRCFLRVQRRFRSAEIVLHPGQPPLSDSATRDGWCDPWADRRPQELRLVLCDELADLFEQTGVRLGRMA